MGSPTKFVNLNNTFKYRCWNRIKIGLKNNLLTVTWLSRNFLAFMFTLQIVITWHLIHFNQE